MARALLADPAAPPAGLFVDGPVPAAAAFRVHRNTILGGLAGALRLSFPTVERLVGADFFDQAAAAFAAVRPPRAAALSAYGDDFADFLAGYGPARELGYLPDVARLDLAIERAAAAADAPMGRLIPLDSAVALALPVSLALLALRHPADRIRAAVEDGSDAALRALDPTPRPSWLAVWRRPDGASVLPLSPPAGRFLAALLEGDPPGQALAAAQGLASSPDAALLAVQAEVFAAPFVAVTPLEPQP
jgi:hypothetical protein